MTYFQNSKSNVMLHWEQIFPYYMQVLVFLPFHQRRAAFNKAHCGFIRCIIVEITLKISENQFK